MGIEGVSGASPTPPAPVAVPAAASGTDAAAFSATLQRYLDQPRREIAAVRSEIAAIRAGDPFWSPPSLSSLQSGSLSYGMEGATRAGRPESLASYLAAHATGDEADPYGWREMSREIADRVIGPGYGAMFERQIDQESGFAPDVVFGERVSSAGAEGIAQLMPQYYPHVARLDPKAGLTAGAETMRHYLGVWGGDVRRALASYNCGLGRVQQLVAAHGANWEAGLPAETRSYLNAILGSAAPQFAGVAQEPVAVFGGRGPGGVLSSPLEQSTASRPAGMSLELFGEVDAAVTAPSDGVVVESREGAVVIDHGNGWRSTLEGMATPVPVGASVRRGDAVGRLGAGGMLRLSLTANGQAVDPRRYLLGIGSI